jgi:hypothetical protein
MKRLNKNWTYIKIVILNWFIFAWIIGLFAGWQLYQAYKEKSNRLDICTNNMEEIEKQIEYGVIQLKLKK